MAHHHALLEVTNGWAEDGLLLQARPFRHLRKVLVLQSEAVRPPWLVLFLLVGLDEALKGY